jgi:hypothetical protein
MNLILILTPFFFVFEVWQLVISERYLGVKQIARGADPRKLGLGEATAFLWTVTLFVYWAWMILLLFFTHARPAAGGLALLSLIGFSLRRGNPLKWTLVILTFEGALRLVLLAYLAAVAWRHA